MRLTRPRFTVRRMMVGLAFIAIVIKMITRYYVRKSIASEHTKAILARYRNHPTLSAYNDDEECYYEINYDKYEHAAARPWEFVPLRFIPFKGEER